MYIMYLCVLYVLYMSLWVSIKMSHVSVKGFLIQSKFEAYSSQIFFQSFFVESKFLKFCIVTQIGASFDHFPYFSDLTEYRFCFVLVSYEIKHVSHDGRNSCHLELLLAHCGQSVCICPKFQSSDGMKKFRTPRLIKFAKTKCRAVQEDKDKYFHSCPF